MPHADPEKRREYERDYWAKPENRERRAEQQKRSRMARAGKELERHRRFRDANPDKAREYSRRYFENNREKERERNRLYREADPDRSRRYYWNNRERARESGRKYYAANKDRVNARTSAAQMTRNHGPDAPEVYAQMLTEQQGRCYLCGRHLTAPGRLAGTAPCIDHDHRCCPPGSSCSYCRRGIACSRCNTLIGLAADNPGLLHEIADNLAAVLATIGVRLAEKPEQLNLAWDDADAAAAVEALPAPRRLRAVASERRRP